jgi:hypothetical protein
MSVKESKKDSEWVQHVKKYAEEHGISYAKALTESKPSYVKPELVPKLVSVPRKPKTQKHDKQSHPHKKTRKSSKKAEVFVSPATPPSPPSPPSPPPRIAEPELVDEHHIPAMKHRKCIAEQEVKRNELREARNAYDYKIKECEEILYGELVKKYFKNLETTKLTHNDLLKGLQRFYKENKKSDTDYILTLDGFIRLFSQKTAVQGANYKRQHIFEAICRLLLLFNYDRNMFGTNKKFYTSLEEFNKMPKGISREDILETPVNVSSKAGIVDIFFRSENNVKNLSAAEESIQEEETNDNTDDWACECINTISKPKSSFKKYNYIMIQNKYYEVEKSSISHYDVTRIYTLASKYQEHDKIFDDGEAKIVLMVNNEDAVSSNLMRAKQQYHGLFAEGDQGIIGVKRLNEWFEKLLFDLLKTNSIPEFESHIGIKASATKPLLQPRFHQKFIIDCTEKYIQGTQEPDSKTKEVSKFIWGAVPRSGKSFMIGGLISNRFKRPENKKNDIVIILGAKTETESQFVKMFKAFDDFSGYNIYVGGKTKQDAQVAGNPTIYLFSQEYLKDKCVWNADVSTSTFKEKEGKDLDLKKRFEGRNIDLYFDEIHKGGSTDNSQSVIYTFKNNKVGINMFIMVTATFAKPSAKYEGLNFIGSGNSKTVTIEWSYNDQQHMKKINDATKLEMFINTRTDVQKKVLEETFDYYHQYYGASYLTVLTSEYAKYPELVLLSPQNIELDVRASASVPSIKLTDLSTNDVRNCFTGNLHCAACKVGEPVLFYKNYRNIFHNVQPVNNVLDFISGSIRNYMKNIVKYPIDSPHTELWFLPDKHLYPGDADCKSKGCTPIVTDESLEADDTDKDVKTGIANIEPLTRGLAYMITDNKPRFEDYNVFIVHNTPFNYLSKREKGKKENEITSEKLFGDITFELTNNDKKMRRKRIGVYDSKKGGLSDQIKAFERESYKYGKSVIVLTGAKLRLGISLPCADIAYNFDDIKSIDANYQTMFRVLTEREKPELKKYGYYFDFNKDRSIQFLYEYNKTYGESKKKSNIQENLEELQSLLFTFNYNGLNIIKKVTTTEVGLYKKLITELRLNEEGYREFWSKKDNIVSMLKRVLNIEIAKELYKLLKISKTIGNKDREFIILKEGLKRNGIPKLVVHNADDAGPGAEIELDEHDEHNEPNKEDYGEIVNQIAESLPTIIALLAMFSVDSGCKTVEECLRHSVEKIMDGASRCTCENIDKSIDSVNILDCFFNSGKITESEIREDATVFDDETDDDTNVQDKHHGGTGKPQKVSKGQKQTKRMKQKNENRQYTKEELKGIMEVLLKIVTNKNDEELTSTINNIFDTIREAVETMPKYEKNDSDGPGTAVVVKGKKDGKHGLIYGMTAGDIEQKITSYLSVREEEKDKFGEVFTPMSLIEEMFDKMPESVWSDPDKKWLDPANGIGNFPMIAYMRLMKGLEKKIPNDQKRSEHIIEKMLFMVEINPKNVKISRRIFGSKANICCADFLNETDKVLKQFNVEKFDVVMGNPPFQDEIDVTNSAAFHGPRKGGKHKLYERITIRCIELLNIDGYLIFITPDNIMTGNTNKAYEEIIKLHVIYISFNNIKKRYFPTVGQPMCYFFIQNTQSDKQTKIEISGENIFLVKLQDRPLNPVREWTKENEELVNKYITNDTNNVVYNRGTSASEYKGGKYEVVYTPTPPYLYTNNIELANGLNIRKVILFETKPLSHGILDATGKYGVGPHTFYVPFNTILEGKILDRFFKSEIYKTLVRISTTSQYLKTSLIKHLNIPNILKSFASTKIQSLVRGHQQRQTARKIKETRKNSDSPKTKKGGSSRRRQKQKMTRKNKFLSWL